MACLSLLRGTTPNLLRTTKGITLEDAPELTRQLWRFLLKTSNVKRKGDTKGLSFLPSEHAFTVGLFVKSVRGRVLFWLFLLVGFTTEFRSCNRNSFCWGILHTSITDILAFIFFKSSTTLYSSLGESWVWMLIGILSRAKGIFRRSEVNLLCDARGASTYFEPGWPLLHVCISNTFEGYSWDSNRSPKGAITLGSHINMVVSRSGSASSWSSLFMVILLECSVMENFSRKWLAIKFMAWTYWENSLWEWFSWW